MELATEIVSLPDATTNNGPSLEEKNNQNINQIQINFHNTSN